jgi:hypothetical protein
MRREEYRVPHTPVASKKDLSTALSATCKAGREERHRRVRIW